MISPVVTTSQPPRKDQLTLDFTPGITDRYSSLRECIASGVYQRSLGRIAIDLNKSPGNLSVELSEDPTRHFSVDSLERYIEKTGDTQPVLYLIERFLTPDAKPQTSERKRVLRALAADLQRQIDELAG